MAQVTWTDFTKLEIRVGTIIEAHDFPEAIKPAYRLAIDFGVENGTKWSSAQITDLYSKEELIGRQVIAVVNFPPKQIGPFISECLVTGFNRPDSKVVLAVPDSSVENGALLA